MHVYRIATSEGLPNLLALVAGTSLATYTWQCAEVECDGRPQELTPSHYRREGTEMQLYFVMCSIIIVRVRQVSL